MTKRADIGPPFGMKIIAVAPGTEIKGRRGDKMVVRAGSAVIEGRNMWLVPEEAKGLQALCKPGALTIQ
jgi:hypothetical protein